MARWTLSEVGTANTYTFDMNPSQASSPVRRRNVTYQTTAGVNGRVLLFEGRAEPPTIQVQGTLLEQAQYTALDTWAKKRAMIDIVDDLGRTFRAVIQTFDATRIRSVTKPWRHDYTIDATVISEF